MLEGLSVAEKNELLFQSGINFNDLPAWQKRGFGCHWTHTAKEGFNPQNGEKTTTLRRIIEIDYELPLGDDYDAFILSMMAA